MTRPLFAIFELYTEPQMTYRSETSVWRPLYSDPHCEGTRVRPWEEREAGGFDIMAGRIPFYRAPRVRASRSRRALCLQTAAACAFFLLAGRPDVRADMTDVSLKNGARLRADLLHRNDERLILDLGFGVLTVPADQVVDVRRESDEAEIGVGAAEGAEGPLSSDAPSTQTGPAPERSRKAMGGSFDEMIGQLEEAVVFVSNAGGLGAGFLIDAAGRLITNFHVVRGEKYNDVTIFLKKDKGKIEKKNFRRVEVRAYSALLDCALLEIPSKELEGIDLPALDLAGPESIKTGARVYAVGNPGVGTKILDHTVSQGILSSTNRNFNDVLYLQTTAAANPGNSGGPLLNGRGEVVGLVTFGAMFQEGLAFALPVWYLRHFLDNLSAYTPVGDSKNTGFRYHDPTDERTDSAGGRD